MLQDEDSTKIPQHMSRWPYIVKGTERGSLEPIIADYDIDAERKGEIPSWKLDMLKKPSVSIRKGIAWGDKPPSEDTDTLVLTASRGAFVDIRIPKPARTTEDAAAHFSFWAFTGRVDTYFFNHSEECSIEMPHMAHCKFVHEIDSHGEASQDDEGDMFDLVNGDCLETGSMLNPATGKVESYKEYWAGVKDLLDCQGRDDSTLCLVARVIEPEDAQGMMIRVGGRIQGVIAEKDKNGKSTVRFERLVRDRFEHGVPVECYDNGTIKSDAWYRDARSSCSLPVSWLCEFDPFHDSGGVQNVSESRVGGTIVHNGWTWRITHQDDPKSSGSE